MPRPPRRCPECGTPVGHGNLARHRQRHWCTRCQDHHVQGELHYQRPVTIGDREALVGYLSRGNFELIPDDPLAPDPGPPYPAPPAEPAGFSPRSTGSAGGTRHAPPA